MLADLATLKQFLRIASSDSSQNEYLSTLLPVADRLVKDFCHRELETAVYTEILDGPGTDALFLQHRPVLCYTLTGTLALNSATVTGISSTASLVVGMPVQAAAAAGSTSQGALPAGTVIQSVDSTSQVTLSQNATLAGSLPLSFGLSVWMDPQAMGGDAPGAFASNTLLVLGVNYALKRDNTSSQSAFAQTSRSGILRFLGAGTLLGTFGNWWGGWGNGAGYQGTLTGGLPPCWPLGWGVIKAVYAAGLGTGAPVGGKLPIGTTIPVELTEAVCAVAAWKRQTLPVGQSIDVASVNPQAAALLMQEMARSPAFTSTVGVLRRYRDRGW